MAFGFGFGFAKNYVAATLSAFNPTSLFAAGEQGVYFNPNNTATLFEDAEGTIPTALERPVGLMLDLSGRGNHATSSSTARPTLTRRVNLLSNTEAFNNATWGKSTVIPPTITAGQAQSPIGSQTADKIALPAVSGANAFCVLFASPTQALSTGHKFSVYLKGNAGGEVVWLSSFGAAYTSTQCILTTEWQKFTLNFTTSASGVQYVQFGVDLRDASQSAKGAQTIYAWGADLRPANFGVGLPAYQRVGDTAINAADYDTTGFPAWLRCSGGQSMVTPSINFTSTDKMTVWAGVRKLSDAATAVFAELSANWNTNNGSFLFTIPDSTGSAGNYASASRGTATANANQAALSSTTLAPVTNVISVAHNISGNLSSLRLNGAANGTNGTGSKGSGNFGNYPLYLFARNQASLVFNGLAGPIIVRGAQSSAAEISNAENWINAQQKVY